MPFSPALKLQVKKWRRSNVAGGHAPIRPRSRATAMGAISVDEVVAAALGYLKKDRAA